jgi:hypothetical protein
MIGTAAIPLIMAQTNKAFIGVTWRCRCTSGKDDEEGDHVGQEHADDGVETDPTELDPSMPRLVYQGHLSWVVADFFRLLGGLPEEQVGADRGSENGDDGGPVILAAMKGGDERPRSDLAPGDLHEEHRQDVAEQHQAQPLEDPGITLVDDEDFQQEAQAGEPHGIEQSGAPDQKLQGGPDAAGIVAGCASDQPWTKPFEHRRVCWSCFPRSSVVRK